MRLLIELLTRLYLEGRLPEDAYYEILDLLPSVRESVLRRDPVVVDGP
jgi:hypothetical protein